MYTVLISFKLVVCMNVYSNLVLVFTASGSKLNLIIVMILSSPMITDAWYYLDSSIWVLICYSVLMFTYSFLSSPVLKNSLQTVLKMLPIYL